MEYRKITENKKQYLSLLLLGDEQESMIDRYLERGEMTVLYEGGEPLAAAVITNEGGGVCELKNIAVAPHSQGRGLGRRLISELCTQWGARCHVMMVGTGDSPATVPFYRRCGFSESHRVKDFFTEHYDHPIYECGVLLTDMVYFSRPLWVLETPRLGFRRLRTEDLAALRPILGDEQTMYAWEYGFTDTQIAEWIERANRRYQTCGYSHHAAVQKESGELIGLMGILPEEIDGESYFGLGYIVARRFWGQGYAMEGAAAWLRYAFDNLGAQQVIADIRPENTASRRVAERLGMTVAGEHMKYHNGKEMPHLIYIKNKED